MTVKIINPTVPGDATHVTHKRAMQLIQRGLAEFVTPTSIRIDIRHHAYRSPVQREYDKAVLSGHLRQYQAKNIPFAGRIARLGLPA